MAAFKVVGFLLLLILSASASGADEVVTVNVNAAKSLLNSKGYLYLDVRTEEEFRKGHLENALNIPYMLDSHQGMVKNPKFIDQVISQCGKEDHLIVGCRSGVRSLHAATDLMNAEFKNVCNMEGGYIAWTEKGFAVEKQHNEEL